MDDPSIIQITDWIESNITSILAHLDAESIAVYTFIQERFQTITVTQDLVFQFIFRSFYRLDNAGLTPIFKTKYFELLEEYRYNFDLDFEVVLRRLSTIKNRKGQDNIQFSFVTKMFSTIYPHRPVYDGEVASMFSYQTIPIGSIEKKIETYLHRYEHILSCYQAILKGNLLPKTNAAFDQKFPEHNLSDIKKLDFIFWAAGKFKKKAPVNAEWNE